MDKLKQRILSDGHIKQGNILKVDSFLNHQMDTALLFDIGEEFHRLYSGAGVTKILTIEASGIGIAVATAHAFGNIPVIFAKKNKSKNLDGELYTASVQSFTKGTSAEIQVASRFLTHGDTVLIIDDFLARGQALAGLLEIVRQSGAAVAGCGIVIEKGFQDGGELIRSMGVRVESLAVVRSIEEDCIEFAQ